MATNQTMDVFEGTDKPQPWHRQHLKNAAGKHVYETPRAYALFRKYLELGSKRSFVKLSVEVGKSRQYVERLASRWHWHERTKKFDDFLADQEMEAFIGERKTMARRQAQIGVLGQNIAMQGLMRIQEELRGVGQQRIFKIHELARLLEVSAKLERLNRGEFDPDQATSIVVHIERQSEPRYKTAGWADADDGKEMDS